MRANSRSARGGSDGKTRGRFSSAGSRYEVLERVGEGTLFVVYKVRERAANRVVALRALKGNFVKNARFVNALAVAARDGEKLVHPHISRIVETGEEDGTLFFVEEWLPGAALEERLRRAPFGRAETLSFTRQIAEALAFLHENGIVHGDLRPRQILASADGNLKLTESGLWPAFLAAGFALTDVQPDVAYYLAPERDGGAQGGNAPPTPASDLYSLGVILYRMLCGRVPFDGPSSLSIAMRHRRDEPMRPSQWNPGCPPDLETVVLRLLAKNPADRFASADDLLSALGGRRSRIAPPVAQVPSPAAPQVAPQSVPQTTPQARIPGYNERLPDVAPAGIAAGAATGVAAGGMAASGVTASGVAVHSTVIATAAAAVTAAAATGASVGAAAVSSAPPDSAPYDTIPPRRLPPPVPQVPRQVDAGFEDDATPIDEIIDEKLERKKQRKREAIGALLSVFWFLVAVGLLAGIIYGGYNAWRQETPRTVAVPAYVGKSRDTAEQLLAQYGLRLVVASEVYDPKRAADTVLKGEPMPGRTVRAGREILVTVSKGEEPIKMPDLRELDLQRARQIIERSGMRMGQISDQYHDSVPKGYIIEQYPEVGQPFRRSEPINLTVSRGPQPVPKTDTQDEIPALPDESATPEDDTTEDPAITNQTSPSETPLISRTVVVKILVPADGEAQQVRIDVQDQKGERTVYRKTHAPGDLINESVRVTRQQGTKATVRVYVDGALQREQVV